MNLLGVKTEAHQIDKKMSIQFLNMAFRYSGNNSTSDILVSRALNSGTHLFLDVFVRRWGNDRKTDKKDICLRVTEWTEPVIVFFPSSIKQPQCVLLATNRHSHGIGVKHLQTNNVTDFQHHYMTSVIVHNRFL